MIEIVLKFTISIIRTYYSVDEMKWGISFLNQIRYLFSEGILAILAKFGVVISGMPAREILVVTIFFWEGYTGWLQTGYPGKCNQKESFYMPTVINMINSPHHCKQTFIVWRGNTCDLVSGVMQQRTLLHNNYSNVSFCKPMNSKFESIFCKYLTKVCFDLFQCNLKQCFLARTRYDNEQLNSNYAHQ